jgi:hypothetical protein
MDKANPLLIASPFARGIIQTTTSKILGGPLHKPAKLFAFALMGLAFLTARTVAQEQNETDPAKALSLVQAAAKARGGDTYLKIRTLTGRGQYTPYDKGVSGNPQSFVDYIAHPGRERTEFGKGDEKFIQSNADMANWVYEAKQKMIREQTEDQVKRFQQNSRYDLDNLLRAAAAQAGVKLIYLGRREPWRSTFSEAVRVDYSDGGSATLHFDPRTHLPLSIEYKLLTAEGAVNNEARYYRWVEYDGVQFPTIQDFYREGKQTARVTYDLVTFNTPLPDKLFAKPANVKEVK